MLGNVQSWEELSFFSPETTKCLPQISALHFTPNLGVDFSVFDPTRGFPRSFLLQRSQKLEVDCLVYLKVGRVVLPMKGPHNHP